MPRDTLELAVGNLANSGAKLRPTRKGGGSCCPGQKLGTPPTYIKRRLTRDRGVLVDCLSP